MYTYHLRATDTLTQHAAHTVAQWRASSGGFNRPAWVEAGDAGLICHDCRTVFVDAVADAYGDTAAQLAEARANRAAGFFTEAMAARDDVAAGAYPQLGAETLTAPVFRNGEVIARVPVQIIGRTIPGAYIVRDMSGREWLAFAGEIRADYGDDEGCGHLTPNPWSLCCA